MEAQQVQRLHHGEQEDDPEDNASGDLLRADRRSRRLVRKACGKVFPDSAFFHAMDGEFPEDPGDDPPGEEDQDRKQDPQDPVFRQQVDQHIPKFIHGVLLLFERR